MVRKGSAFSPFVSVVVVQDLFAPSPWESEVCAQSARLQQKYAVIASSVEILVIGTSIILSLRASEVQQKACQERRGLAHPFQIKTQNQRLPPPCSRVLFRGKGGNLTCHPQLKEIKIPAPPVERRASPPGRRRDKSGAPSRIKMRKGWASPQVT